MLLHVAWSVLLGAGRFVKQHVLFCTIYWIELTWGQGLRWLILQLAVWVLFYRSIVFFLFCFLAWYSLTLICTPFIRKVLQLVNRIFMFGRMYTRLLCSHRLPIMNAFILIFKIISRTDLLRLKVSCIFLFQGHSNLLNPWMFIRAVMLYRVRPNRSGPVCCGMRAQFWEHKWCLLCRNRR